MNFFQRFFQLFPAFSSNSRPRASPELICGIGESRILEHGISINNYPFEPSVVYPNRFLAPHEIHSVCWEAYPPMIRIADEVIFLHRNQKDSLQQFANAHALPTFKPTYNWNRLLEPFLDTVITEQMDLRLTTFLMKHGIFQSEIDQIRKEVGPAMYAYNFDSMLWEWADLGLPDVLSAMRYTLKEADFAVFFAKSMELELRTGSSSIT
ncbi:MAG: hypothetical protein AAF587_04655 [Bacteroidota bacterium]